MRMMNQYRTRGFALVEIIVGLGVFLLFSVGMYSSIQLVFKVVYQSRLHSIETALLNEEIEIIRNVPYDSVGIVSSTPPGILERTTVVIRNNIPFTIIRTVRNVDDPFDGTIGGAPNDASPADYKFVQVSITCGACSQDDQSFLSTSIAPDHMEGTGDTGALFVSVVDADAHPVEGAVVHIVATSTDPAIDMIDVTDSAGILREVALPSGTSAYAVSVTKSGYTFEETRMPTAANPNPITPPASVIRQQITQENFTIDRVSSVAISTMDSQCVDLPGVPVQFFGTRLIGVNPEMLLVNTMIATDASGSYASGTIPWDIYTVAPQGYDLLGVTPGLPVPLLPGSAQPIHMVLGPETGNAILVHVRDRVSLLPLSHATVTVTSTAYTDTKTTGVGHIRQTDWSGGNGQEIMENPVRYWADNSALDTQSPGGEVRLLQSDGEYAADGMLESSIFDVGTGANFVNIIWNPLSQPLFAGVHSLKFQIATSNSSTIPVWNYLGYDGTEGTYYDEEHTSVNDIHNGSRFVRYKAFFHTESSAATPVLSDVSLSYTTSCSPPGQAYFGDLDEAVHTVTVAADGYQTVVEDIPVSGQGNVVIDMTAL